VSAVPDPILRAADDPKALFAINVSGGKDGQASGTVISALVPPERQVYVHASLGYAEWPGALEAAQAQAMHAEAEFLVTQGKRDFIEMVLDRHAKRPDAPCWPSPKFRLCTSTLKTTPLESLIKRTARERGYTTVVNVMGLRAEESRNRATKLPCVHNAGHSIAERVLRSGQTKAGRTWIDYLPIHGYSTEEVFGAIYASGQQAHHAYALGNSRMSCILCHMGCMSDLRNGAQHNPNVYQMYARTEVMTGWSLHPSGKTLPQLTGIPVEPLN